MATAHDLCLADGAWIDSKGCCGCGPTKSAFMDLHKGLERAIAKYESDAAKGISRGPYRVASGVYESVFEVWSLGLESRWKLAFVGEAETRKGDIWLYGDPSRLHEVIPGYVHGEFVTQMVLSGIRRIDQVLRWVGSTRIPLFLETGVIHKEPDAAWVPAGQDPNSHPSMVLEVAVCNESVPRLKQEVGWWAKSGVAVSIGIKIDVKTKVGIVSYKLTFFIQELSRFSEQLQEIDFSPGVCTEENRFDYVVKVPLSSVLRGGGGDLSASNLELEIDLYEMQQIVLATSLKEFIPDDGVCFCRSTKIDESTVQHVAVCSNLECDIGVFHMDCVNATYEDLDPESHWLCPYCRR